MWLSIARRVYATVLLLLYVCFNSSIECNSIAFEGIEFGSIEFKSVQNIRKTMIQVYLRDSAAAGLH
jgi:hypothetical protein